MQASLCAELADIEEVPYLNIMLIHTPVCMQLSDFSLVFAQPPMYFPPASYSKNCPR